MNSKIKDRLKTIVLHFLFWVGIWFFFVYFFGYNSVEEQFVYWFSSLLIPITLTITYFIVYFLIPKFLLTKKYWKFTLYTFYTLVVSAYIIVLAIYVCLIFLLRFNISIMPPMSKNFYFIFVLVYMVVGMVSFVSILRNSFKTQAKYAELEKKILQTQLQLENQKLNYLKMQIHPHFLFNTMNTIYGFAMKQSKQTPELILKLSNLLDYILYQINKPMVSLKEEVLHIKEYIELEKMRFQDTLEIKFENNEIDESIQVAPMLLIPFVENAFKHGQIVKGTLLVEIKIHASEDQMNFIILNSIKEPAQRNTEHGIGLQNIRNRLDLHYNESYQLLIEETESTFKVELQINNLKNIQNV